MTADLSLRDLIASINAKKSLEKKTAATPPAAKKPPVPLTLVQSQNLARTGYISWKPVSYTIQTTRQICACCGAETEAVTGEFFTYENGTAHAVWSHREGYGIEDPDDLPIAYVEAEPKHVRACASCRWAHVDLVQAIQPSPKQLSLRL